MSPAVIPPKVPGAKPTPTPNTAPTLNKGGALGPSEQASNVTFTQNVKGKSISGLPLGSKVQVGVDVNKKPIYAMPQYTEVSPYQAYETLDNQGRANLLLRMASIKGLYSKNDILASANAANYIASQGTAVTFRPEDFTALGKLMAHADQSGNDYSGSIQQFITDPGLAQQYFGKPTAAKAITLSSPASLELDINNKFLDLFDERVDSKTAKAYSTEILKAQQAAGGANKLDPTLAESIFQKYVAKKANTLVTNALDKTDPNAKPITGGAFGISVTQIRNAYTDNYLPLDDKKIYKDAIAASRSTQAKQNIMQNIQMKATQYYPAIAEGIKNGQTVSDLLSAPITSYASVFGVKANQVPQSFLSKIASGTNILSQDDVQKVIWNSDGIEKAPGYRAQQLSDFKTMMDTFGIGPV
jgi:hypothetical protein